MLVAAACGGDSGETTEPAATSTNRPAPTVTTEAASGTTAAELSPTALGDRIGEVYLEAIEDVVAATADRPDGAVAMAALLELKERHIETLVELGRRREALDSEGREAVDGRISRALVSVPPDLFEAYMQAQADYRDIDPGVAELITSFNIITQYASFDLLRQQEPEEAARVLGE